MKSTCKWFVYLQNRNTLVSLVISLLLNSGPVLAWKQTQSCYSCTGSIPPFSPSLWPFSLFWLHSHVPRTWSDTVSLNQDCHGALEVDHSKYLFISNRIVTLGCSSPLQILFAGFIFQQIEARQYKYLLCNQIRALEIPLLPSPRDTHKNLAVKRNYIHVSPNFYNEDTPLPPAPPKNGCLRPMSVCSIGKWCRLSSSWQPVKAAVLWVIWPCS